MVFSASATISGIGRGRAGLGRLARGDRPDQQADGQGQERGGVGQRPRQPERGDLAGLDPGQVLLGVLDLEGVEDGRLGLGDEVERGAGPVLELVVGVDRRGGRLEAPAPERADDHGRAPGPPTRNARARPGETGRPSSRSTPR